MIKFFFNHPDFTAHTYNLVIEGGNVMVLDPDGTPLGVVAKGENGWEQASGREFHYEMALAIGRFIEDNSYI